MWDPRGAAGTDGPPIPAGSVIEYGSWRICLHAMGGAFIVQLLLTFFFMPETAFRRTGTLDIDTGAHAVEGPVSSDKAAAAAAEHVETASGGSVPAAEARHSFARELLPYAGYFDGVSFWRTALQPFVMLASPVVLWATLLFTTCISWLVLISVTLSQIFSAPPYSFSVSAVGASNLSSFVATLLATALAGPLIDGLVRWMARRNNGTFGASLSLSVSLSVTLSRSLALSLPPAHSPPSLSL